MTEERLQEILGAIDPGSCDYTEWVQVGMALKHEGFTAHDWETWSSRDAGRYHPGECYKKWESFNEQSAAVVTGGTLYQMARDRGWDPDEGGELDWDSEVYAYDYKEPKQDDQRIIDTRWVEAREIDQPGANWDPVNDLTRYIETLFQMDEFVGSVTACYTNEAGKKFPTKGDYSQTAGEILAALRKTHDIGAVLGDADPEAGAWIRFNPLDGKGCKNENVTEYRFALVESDTMEVARQNAIIRELELPVACLVYSGGKSLHAIVKIDASNYDEYRKRVDFLYTICKKNGLSIDTQNRNPSRLSRMPGVTRGQKKQFLVDTNIGKKDWQEWREFIDAANDDLPDPENLESIWENIPELADPLIDGVLRQGHKMLIAGPSKAGKSFALIELCCAIAEGRQWLGWNCTQGRVLYVNLELDRPSCLHRFRDVYSALGWPADNLKNIDIWNLRGASIPMDKLAPRLIRRASKKDFIAVVIDPIYKVITGDENSADQMAHFCNQFDKVCTELGCAVIYCHHHSKGSQGDKRSMDRASGSGVFARDPDALLDIIELEQTPTIKKKKRDRAECEEILAFLDQYDPHWEEEWPITTPGARFDAEAMREQSEIVLPPKEREALQRNVDARLIRERQVTPWRIEGTLREFPKFDEKNVWFSYPVHKADDSGVLTDAEAEGARPGWQKAIDARKDPEVKRDKRAEEFEAAFDALNIDGQEVTVKDIMDYTEWSASTVKNRVKEHPDFELVSCMRKNGGNGPSLIRRKAVTKSGDKK